jgi:hypothetical protein
LDNAKLKDYKHHIDLGELKEAKDITGVVDNPIWDFIEPSNFMFPQLHVEIGLVNNVLDNRYEFFEEQIVVARLEQKVAKNKVIIADVGCARAKDRLLEWNSQRAVNLAMFRIQKTHLIANLRRNRTADLLAERVDLEQWIDQLIGERKRLEKTAAASRKELTNNNNNNNNKAELKGIVLKKTKIDKPAHSEIENLLNVCNISAAAYYGGKLNWVDCQCFMQYASDIFSKILFLESQNAERCSHSIIEHEMQLQRDICVVMDTVCSRLHKKTG